MNTLLGIAMRDPNARPGLLRLLYIISQTLKEAAYEIIEIRPYSDSDSSEQN